MVDGEKKEIREIVIKKNPQKNFAGLIFLNFFLLTKTSFQAKL